ncbi:MAG: porin [Gemmatimonadaceae bacterium]
MRTLAFILLVAVEVTFGQAARAQGNGSTPVTFDLLQAARAADSLRQVVTRQRGEIARLNRTLVALNDTIKSARKAPVAAVKPSDDTMHSVAARIDFVIAEPPKANGAPAAPAAPSTEPATPAQPAPSAPATAPAAVTFAPPQFTGLLQLWAFGGDASYRSTVRIRRAEVKLVSDLGRRARASVVFDVAKSLALSTGGAGQVSVSQSSRVLQDGFISMPVRRVQIDAGQQKIPLGAEGMQSSSALESAERALMFSDRARGGTFGDIRDLGLVVRQSASWGEFHAGVFNGSGENQNEVDRNVAKSVIGRAALKVPGVRGLQVGGSGATSGPATLDKPTRDRVGAEVLYRFSSLSLQVEGMRGQDGSVVRRGAYALAAYTITPRVRVHARADGWDPDAGSESTSAAVTERDYVVGATWMPAATRLKLQVVGVRKTYTRNLVPAATQAILNMQASW